MPALSMTEASAPCMLVVGRFHLVREHAVGAGLQSVRDRRQLPGCTPVRREWRAQICGWPTVRALSDRDRQTGRQADRQTDRQTENERASERAREREREREQGRESRDENDRSTAGDRSSSVERREARHVPRRGMRQRGAGHRIARGGRCLQDMYEDTTVRVGSGD